MFYCYSLMQNYINISHSFSPIFPPHYYCGFKTSCQIAFLVTCGYKNKAKMRLKAIAICFFLLGSMAIVKAQEVPTAATVLETAQKQAKKEKKKVFVMFHASWCSWCKKMEKNMQADAVKKMFDDNYVTTFLTVQEHTNKALENPGAAELLAGYKGDKSGIPFWVILDEKGKVLADSFNAKGENLGCPATPEEVAEFNAKLKKTSKLTDKDLAVITETFVIKK